MPYYRYPRRKYKEKKHIPSDLELLGYSDAELAESITRINKSTICSGCSTETILISLNTSQIYSGQYGIYFRCDNCHKNVSISTKVDFDKDNELKNITQKIKNFNDNIKIAKKDFYTIASISQKLKKERQEDKANLLRTISEKQKEANEISMQYRKLQIFNSDIDLVRGISEHFGFKQKEHEEVHLEGDSYTYLVKIGHVTKFKELFKIYKNKYSEIRHLEKQTDSADLIKEEHFEKKYRASYNFIRTYCIKQHYEKSLYKRLSHIENLDPNKNKDLETIEELYLKPLIKEKEKRILLLKKIFRSSKGNIYVLESDAMPGFYKVGWTEKSPDERAKQLSGTSMPEPYRVIYSQSTNLTGDVEKEIHKTLDEFRHRSNREFFKGDLELIKKTIKETLTN